MAQYPLLFPERSIQKERFFFRAIWGKAYSKALIERQNLRFAEDLPAAEDIAFNCACLATKDARILYADSTLYFYRMVPDSLSRRYQPGYTSLHPLKERRIREALGAMADDEEVNEAFGVSYVQRIPDSLQREIANPNNPKPYAQRLDELKALTRSEPCRTALKKCPWKRFPLKHKILIVLLRMGLENVCLKLADSMFR